MTTHRRSLSFAKEPSFGALGSGSPLPDPSSLSYKGILCDRANIAPSGEAKIASREVSRRGPYALPAKPATLYDDAGQPIPRKSGQVKVTLRALLLGTGAGHIADYEEHPIAAMLGATLCDAGDLGMYLAVSGEVGENSFTAPSGALSPGELFKVIINGLTEYSAVTKVLTGSTDTVIHSPACSRALSTSDTLRKMRTFYIANGAQSPGKSLSFQMDGHGWRQRAFGCRWSECTISLDGDEAVFSFTFEAPFICDYNDETEVLDGTNLALERIPDGPSTTLLGGVPVLSATDAGRQSAGAALGRIPLDVEGFSLSIKATLAPRGTSTSILGISEQVVADVNVELSLTLSNVLDELKGDLWREVQRSVLLAFGGRVTGAGMVFFIPCAVPKVDRFKELQREISGFSVDELMKLKPREILDAAKARAKLATEVDKYRDRLTRLGDAERRLEALNTPTQREAQLRAQLDAFKEQDAVAEATIARLNVLEQTGRRLTADQIEERKLARGSLNNYSGLRRELAALEEARANERAGIRLRISYEKARSDLAQDEVSDAQKATKAYERLIKARTAVRKVSKDSAKEKLTKKSPSRSDEDREAERRAQARIRLDEELVDRHIALIEDQTTRELLALDNKHRRQLEAASKAGLELTTLEAMQARERAALEKEILEEQKREEDELAERRWNHAIAYSQSIQTLTEAVELMGFGATAVQAMGLVGDMVESGVKASKETAASIAAYAAYDYWGGTQHALAAASYGVAAAAAGKGLAQLGHSGGGGGGGSGGGAAAVPTAANARERELGGGSASSEPTTVTYQMNFQGQPLIRTPQITRAVAEAVRIEQRRPGGVRI